MVATYRKDHSFGFSLIELMIVLSVGSVVLLGTVVFIERSFKQQREQVNKVDYTSQNLVLSRIIVGDMSQSSVSFNVINSQKDKFDNNFFDHVPDLPSSKDENREILLNPINNKSITFIVQDEPKGARLSLMLYEPVAAYEIGPAPNNFFSAATITWAGMNRNNYITNQRSFWNQGNLLMLDVSSFVRPTGDAEVGIAKYPVVINFIGYVNDQTLDQDPFLKELVYNRSPITGAEIKTPDDFFRHLPSVGGGVPIVRLRQVKVVRYWMDQMPNNSSGLGRLWRSVYQREGQFSSNQLLADHLESFVFKRTSIKERIIYFSGTYK